MNPFQHCGIEELLAWRDRLLNAIVAGSQTRVGVSGGVAHEFEGKSEKELRGLLDDVYERLFELDPETYPDPSETARPGVTRLNFNTC